MSRTSPYFIDLSEAERAVLEQRCRCYSAPHRVVVRANIVLLASDGWANVDIALELGTHVDVVSKWRKRYCQEGAAGLADRRRSGRPRTYPGELVAQVKAMACEPPSRRDVPLSRWSSASTLAAQAVAEGLVADSSASTVRRWLAEDAIRPWQFRSWIFPRDPHFSAKAARVLDLYGRVWEGHALGPDNYVVSADEKSQLQALSRWHPGTLAYFGAYDVHRATLIGHVAPTTGIVAFAALVKKLMSTEPYSSARKVYWVVGNGYSHAGRASVKRMAEAWPTITLVHLPVHASGLNQVEVVFSVVHRKVVKGGDYADLLALADALVRFEARYNSTAKPFDWAFTRAELAELCRRIDAHAGPGELALAA